MNTELVTITITATMFHDSTSENNESIGLLNSTLNDFGFCEEVFARTEVVTDILKIENIRHDNAKAVAEIALEVLRKNEHLISSKAKLSYRIKGETDDNN